MARKRTTPTGPPGQVEQPSANLVGLVQACKDEPENDGLRGILADYLEDHGEPDRAELIRASLQVDRPSIEPASRAVALARILRLRHDHDARWLGALRHLRGRVTFTRGLLDLTVEPAALRKESAAEALQAAALWSESLKLDYRKPSQAVDYAAMPCATAFSRLDLSLVRLGREHLEAIAQSTLAPHLRSLRVMAKIQPRGALLGLFRSTEGVRHLRCLALHSTLHPHEARALVTASFARNLRTLSLTGGRADGEAMTTLIQAESLAGLEQIRLTQGCDPPILLQLAASPTLQRLRTLRLEGVGLRDDAGETLARSPILASVRSLNLASNPISNATVRALAESPHATHLEELDLSHPQEISGSTLQALGESPNLRNLRRLNLAQWNIHHSLPAASLEPLARSAVLSKLEALDLSGNHLLTQGDILALAHSPHLTAFGDLNLSGIMLRKETITELLQSPLAGRLRRLCLGSLFIGDDIIDCIARSPALERLEALELGYPAGSIASLVRLMESTTLQRLVWLRMPLPADPTEPLVALAEARGLPALTFLGFSNGSPSLGNLPPVAARALAASPRRQHLFRMAIHWHPSYPTDLHPLCQPLPQMSRE